MFRSSLTDRWRLTIAIGTVGVCVASCLAPTPETRRWLEDASMMVRVERQGAHPTIQFLARGTDTNRFEPIASLQGVRLLIDQQPAQQLRFSFFRSEKNSLVASCAPHQGHKIRLRIQRTDLGELMVQVTDEVGLRSPLRELTLDYDVAPLCPSDEVHLPMVQGSPDHLVGDAAFRAPLAMVRRGTMSLSLLPTLDDRRRLPQGIELDTKRPYRLRHGLICYETTQTTEHAARCSRKGAGPVEVMGETLRFRHHLIIRNQTNLKTKGALLARLWDEHAAGQLSHSSLPLTQPLRQLANEALARARHEWRTVQLGGWKGGTLAQTSGDGRRLQTRFDARNQNLRTAWALARHARATTDPQLRKADLDKAQNLVELALRAPRRAGLLPSRLTILHGDDKQARWHLDDGRFGLPNHYHTLHVASTYLWMLRLQQELGDQKLRQRVLQACEETCRFMIGNQTRSGDIPSFYEPNYLAPNRSPRLATNSELGAVARFMIEYSVVSGDAKAMQAARQALAHLVDPCLTSGRWVDTESALSEPKAPLRDPRSGQWRNGSLGIIQTALAALRLFEIDRSESMQVLAERALAELASFQQVWQPRWRLPRPTTVGGFGNHNASAAWNTGREALAAETFFRGFAVLKDFRLLQRGVAALRAALHRDPGDTRATVAALQALTRLGDGVVDVAGAQAQGIESIWFEELSQNDNRISFRLHTHVENLGACNIRFHQLGDHKSMTVVANGLEIGTFSAEDLAKGIPILPRRLARIRFAPPPEVRKGKPWLPRAQILGKPTSRFRAFVEIARADAAPQQVPLDLVGKALLAPEPIIASLNADKAGKLQARLVFEEQDGLRIYSPRTGYRTIQIGEFNTIDAGEGDEFELDDPGNSVVRRFSNGIEDARLAWRHSSFTYKIPVHTQATGLELELSVTGRMTVHARKQLLHEDPEGTDLGIRTIRLQLTDRRLWPNGRLPLTFRAADPAAAKGTMLARIRFRESGRTVINPEAGHKTSHRQPDQKLLLLVQPVQLADRQNLAGVEVLRQAIFGGSDYRVTPAPNARQTAGSVATVLRRISGGRTDVEGEVLAPLHWQLPVGEIGTSNAGQWPGIPINRTPKPDVVLCVLGGNVDKLPNPQRINGVPVVFLSERETDGSFLSTGRVLASLLRARYGLQTLEDPSRGNFGSLALLAGSTAHLPPPLTGRSMARTGWSDLVELEPTNHPDLQLVPLDIGRASFVLPEILPGRGRLFLDAQRTGKADQVGALIYRELPTSTDVYLRNQSGAEARPTLLRLSAGRSRLETPFVPGDTNDLFVRTRGRINTTTPQGERLWEISQVRPTEKLGVQLRVTCLASDLLAAAQRRTWSTSTGAKQPAPIAVDGKDRPSGSVTPLATGFRIQTPRIGGGRIHLRQTIPAGSLRLFAGFRQVRGDVILRVRVGNNLLFEQAIKPTPRHNLQLNLPTERQPQVCELEVEHKQGAEPSSLVLDQWFVAPRSRALAVPNLTRAKLGGGQLMDGTNYGTHPVLVGNGQTHKAPLVVPAGKVMLRLVAGLAFAAGVGRGGHLHIELQDATASRRHVLLANHKIQRKHRPDRAVRQPIFIGLLEVPPSDKPRTAFLVLRWKGDTELHLPTLILDHP